MHNSWLEQVHFGALNFVTYILLWYIHPFSVPYCRIDFAKNIWILCCITDSFFRVLWTHKPPPVDTSTTYPPLLKNLYRNNYCMECLHLKCRCSENFPPFYWYLWKKKFIQGGNECNTLKYSWCNKCIVGPIRQCEWTEKDESPSYAKCRLTANASPNIVVHIIPSSHECPTRFCIIRCFLSLGRHFYSSFDCDNSDLWLEYQVVFFHFILLFSPRLLTWYSLCD